MANTRKYTKELLGSVVAQSESVAGVLRLLGLAQAGGMHSHISNTIKSFGIDTSHFLGQGHQKGRPCNNGNKKTAAEILVVLPEGSRRAKPHLLRRALIECGLDYMCAGACGTSDIWNDNPITLEIDHINDNWLDNRLENLQFLCPNCHSQKPSSHRKKQGAVVELADTSVLGADA